MDKIKKILKTEFDIECTDIAEIQGGLSATNYRIKAGDDFFFLKVYDKNKAQASLWTENIDHYMPILIWLNENTGLKGRIVHPIRTNKGDYRFEDGENVFLLLDYIEGKVVGEAMTDSQIAEAADILASLHNKSSELPVNADKLKENFSVPFCYSLEHYFGEGFSTSPDDVKAILQPCLDKLTSINNQVKVLSEKVKRKSTKMVLCHTDAHGWNFMQNKHLVLIDWEGMKLAPAEADLVMFTKKEYWDVFMESYHKFRPEFTLDNDLLSFYILRRKIEDIWAFLESILFDDQSDKQRENDMAFLKKCCDSLDNFCFEL